MSTLSQFTGGGSSISTYTQTATLTSSQTVAVPPGTKRIEALLCGGGGGGGGHGGGGFGGLQIYDIPVVGSSISLIVGAGGPNLSRGGTTSVSVGNVLYAAVGGGGGSTTTGDPIAGFSMHGLFGGGGAGGYPGGGCGGAPFSIRNLLWSAMDVAPRTGNPAGSIGQSATGGTYPNYGAFYQGPGSGALPGTPAGGFSACRGVDGSAGYGGGGGMTSGANHPTGYGNSGAGGGGGYNNYATNLTGAGGGAGASNGVGGYTGGSLVTISVWGLTGFAGGLGAGPAAGYGGGGGGGMLGAGGNAVTTVGGAGGNGGGGGGGGTTGTTAGGNGFAIFRFYS